MRQAERKKWIQESDSTSWTQWHTVTGENREPSIDHTPFFLLIHIKTISYSKILLKLFKTVSMRQSL